MKINRYQPVQPYEGYHPAKPADHQEKPAATSDKIEISAEARRLQGASKLEDARAEKVKQIKARVDAGTYHVKSEDVARKLYDYWNRR
ncbi:flagellar biosynthesis anti-sigma factor FlgM [Sporolactobacillus sp. THM7-4]|nr:flagellar biosynthesis anti-sigma factor FlgM [Sporolactobacillus sp. THM7-4]